MRKLAIAVALTLSTAALAVPEAVLPKEPVVTADERVDIDRMLTCGLYHQAIYPDYVETFLMAGNMIHQKSGNGELDTRYPRYTLMAKVAAAQVESWTLEEFGASLVYCIRDLDTTVTKYDLLKYAGQLQRMQ